MLAFGLPIEYGQATSERFYYSMTSSSHQSPLDPFESQSDVGSIRFSGSCLFYPDQQSYTITGAGSNIWGDHDEFHFVWRRLRGDFIATTQAEFIGEGVNPHRKLGWMARSSLDTGSAQVCT